MDIVKEGSSKLVEEARRREQEDKLEVEKNLEDLKYEYRSEISAEEYEEKRAIWQSLASRKRKEGRNDYKVCLLTYLRKAQKMIPKWLSRPETSRLETTDTMMASMERHQRWTSMPRKGETSRQVQERVDCLLATSNIEELEKVRKSRIEKQTNAVEREADEKMLEEILVSMNLESAGAKCIQRKSSRKE